MELRPLRGEERTGQQVYWGRKQEGCFFYNGLSKTVPPRVRNGKGDANIDYELSSVQTGFSSQNSSYPRSVAQVRSPVLVPFLAPAPSARTSLPPFLMPIPARFRLCNHLRSPEELLQEGAEQKKVEVIVLLPTHEMDLGSARQIPTSPLLAPQRILKRWTGPFNRISWTKHASLHRKTWLSGLGGHRERERRPAGVKGRRMVIS